MDVLKSVSSYLSRLLSPTASGGTGMKVLLVDSHTTPILSVAMTQSTLLQHEVYLTDRIDNTQRQRMRHLKCIAFLRPCEESVQALCQELAWPKYGSYWIYFTNVLSKSAIESIAEADEHEVVKELQEYFADYIPINSSLFALSSYNGASSLPTPIAGQPPVQLGPWANSPHEWNEAAFERHRQGITALLLSLKKKPVIRYERMSALAKRLAEEVAHQTTQGQPSLFDFRKSEAAPLLLILDRRNDPVTPLLTQWTYQAMVHELLGIQNGRVSLSTSSDVRPEQRELVLSTAEDQFFQQNLYDNFGDLGASIKRYVLEFQTRTASSKQIETVQDMKRFVEEYPEFRKLSGNVSKHVTLVGELSRKVEAEHLLEVSEVEQSLASNESHAQDVKAVFDIVNRPDISSDAKLRVCILYALRYQKHPSNQISQLVAALLQQGLPESKAGLVFVMLNLAGAEQRQDDLFSNEGFFSRGRSALQRGLKGVENVYTQHTPHMAATLEALMKGRLKESSYPYAGRAGLSEAYRPQDIIVFIIGGATFEEARYIHLLNQQYSGGNGPLNNGIAGSMASNSQSSGSAAVSPQPVSMGTSSGTRFLLGGSVMLNSESWLNTVQDAATRFGPSVARPPSTPAGSAQGQGLNLRIGPVQLNVGGGDTSTGGLDSAGPLTGPGGLVASARIGEAAQGAVELAGGLWGRLKEGVGR
ncbi:unnamed protein product [Parajaminaea phylloscopi]